MLRKLISIFLLLFPLVLTAQDFNPDRVKKLHYADTLKIDTLSLIYGSVKIFNDTEVVDSTTYLVDFAKANIVFKQKPANIITVKYSVLPFDFSKKQYHKPMSLINHVMEKEQGWNEDVFMFPDKNNQSNKLIKTGSISRGITTGNNQSTAMNGNMNLQLSGQLSDNINIEAVISDENIPLQPDGNTQQLQDFNKVFISVFNDKSRLTVGDLELSNPVGNFLRINQKVQGVQFSQTLGKDNNHKFTSLVTGSLSKGSYHRMSFTGIEGNQGPYKLKGANNEDYIVILSGTEKVYIDGQLLERGEQNHYIIDYNSGEITFTPKRIITKDSRIIVEFQYSTQNYTHYLIENSNVWNQSENQQFYFNVFLEQDAKNQSILQTLTDSNKILLSGIGNNLSQAFTYAIDSMVFDASRVMYRKIDTTVNAILYSGVLEYSTNPNEAHYSVRFSYVGSGNGNYKLSPTDALGRVYMWVAPENGIKQGDYEPIIPLATPQKKQLFTFGGETKLGKQWKTDYEIGFSNQDPNLFSSIDNAKNQGVAARFNIEKQVLLSDTNYRIVFSAGYELFSKYFKPIERIKSTEFLRDWNLTNTLPLSDEHLLTFKVGLMQRKKEIAYYRFRNLIHPNSVYGYFNQFSSDYQWKKIFVKMNVRDLAEKQFDIHTHFFRYNASGGKIFKKTKVGLVTEGEINYFTQNTNYLLSGSNTYHQVGGFVTSNDTTGVNYLLAFKQRTDQLPDSGRLYRTTQSNEVNAMLGINTKKNSTFKLFGNARQLKVLNGAIYGSNHSESNMNSRLEFLQRALRSGIFFQTQYLIGTGQETKRIYSYIKVPEGQGSFTWIDYNNDSIPQLSEFEQALYPDQANFIRMLLPTDEYIQTFSTQFSQTLNVLPYRFVKRQTGLPGLVRRFSDRLVYQINTKTINNNFYLSDIEPFSVNVSDTALLTYRRNIRNRFVFNERSTVWQIGYMIQDFTNKILLVNGADRNGQTTQSVELKINFTKQLFFKIMMEQGTSQYQSDYLKTKNYNLRLLKNDMSITYQPDTRWKTSLNIGYHQKVNDDNITNVYGNNYGVAFYNYDVRKGNLIFTFEIIDLRASAGMNPVLSYVLLNGLQHGKNSLWSVNYQIKLNKTLQLSLNYRGRLAQNTKAVHFGTVQLRAMF